MSDLDIYSDLLKHVLPEGILDYFEIVQVVTEPNTLNIHLEERNLPLSGYENEKLTLHGFYKPITVQDFPIRGKALYLHIKRRRWLVESSGKTVSRDWNMVASGTRLTKEFASFLKDTFGDTPC